MYLRSCSTPETWPCTSPQQHISVDLGYGSVGEPTGQEGGRAGPSCVVVGVMSSSLDICKVRRGDPEGMKAGEVAQLPANGSTGFLAGAVLELLMVVWIRESQHADQLTYHVAHIQGSDLSHSKIYIVWEPLGCVQE